MRWVISPVPCILAWAAQSSPTRQLQHEDCGTQADAQQRPGSALHVPGLLGCDRNASSSCKVHRNTVSCIGNRRPGALHLPGLLGAGLEDVGLDARVQRIRQLGQGVRAGHGEQWRCGAARGWLRRQALRIKSLSVTGRPSELAGALQALLGSCPGRDVSLSRHCSLSRSAPCAVADHAPRGLATRWARSVWWHELHTRLGAGSIRLSCLQCPETHVPRAAAAHRLPGGLGGLERLQAGATESAADQGLLLTAWGSMAVGGAMAASGCASDGTVANGDEAGALSASTMRSRWDSSSALARLPVACRAQ